MESIEWRTSPFACFAWIMLYQNILPFSDNIVLFVYCVFWSIITLWWHSSLFCNGVDRAGVGPKSWAVRSDVIGSHYIKMCHSALTESCLDLHYLKLVSQQILYQRFNKIKFKLPYSRIKTVPRKKVLSSINDHGANNAIDPWNCALWRNGTGRDLNENLNYGSCFNFQTSLKRGYCLAFKNNCSHL